MDTKKFLMGTLAGGIALFFLGYLFYGVLFMGFFEANQGTATGVMKEDMQLVWWALILGNLALGALLSYIFLKWANISTFGSGAQAAAVIGLLTSLSWDMISLATTNIGTLTGALADVAVFTVMCAIAGGVVGMVLGMGKEPAAAAA